MPVYNGEGHVRLAIDSILAQTYTDFELVISDNASIDGTERICREYVKQDKRIHYIRNEQNIGVVKNYNRLFGLCRSEYFKWASSTDTCHPRFVEACIAALEEHPDAVLAYPKTRLTFGDGQTQDYDDALVLDQESPQERFIACVLGLRFNNMFNGVFRTAALGQTRLHGDYRGGDINMMAEVALNGKIILVDEFLFFRTMDARTTTNFKSLEELKADYYPKYRHGPTGDTWHFYFDRFAIVCRSRLPVAVKLSLSLHVLRWIRWHRWDLLGELLPRIAPWFRTTQGREGHG